jgi:hypothetical protein
MTLLESGRLALQKLGIDRAIAYVVAGRLWMVLAGLVTLMCIGLWLSRVEQGYYYTFASLLTVQVFFELGLTNVVMQFASHERALLGLSAAGHFEGDAAAKSRLASLIRLCLRWYGVMALVFAAALVPTGFIFFKSQAISTPKVPWEWPWIFTVLATAGLLFLSPLLGFLEGCGFVAEVAKLRLFQSIMAHLALWSALIARLGVASTAAFSLVSLLFAAVWVWVRHRALFFDLLRSPTTDRRISWRAEMLPYQWRIAVSWVSGYFISQIFTPVLFAFRGPVEAGKMGMSLAMMGAVSTLSLAWITTKAPVFGGLVAQKRLAELNRAFAASFKKVLLVSSAAACLLATGVVLLNATGQPFAGRVLPPAAFVPLVLSTLVSVVVTSMAIYLRAFKREPFLPVSIMSGALVGITAYFFGRDYGATLMMLGYLAANAVVGLGMGTWIFLRKRTTWTANV